MKIAFYNAEHQELADVVDHPGWTPDDVRMYVFDLQVRGAGQFDSLDWLLAWNESKGPVAVPEPPYFSVFVLGDIDNANLDESHLDRLRQMVQGVDT